MMAQTQVNEVRSKSAQICVPIGAATVCELKEAITRANSIADMLELRLDYLNGKELYKAVRNLNEILSITQHPVILTLRSAEQRGRSCLDTTKRQEFWLEYLAPDKHLADFTDLELDAALRFMSWEREGRLKLDWTRIVCSHHDFGACPPDLEEKYDRLARTPARVLKLAFRARQITDTVAVFNLLERARHEGRELIPIAMGDAGMLTRILSPSRGGFLTFGSLDNAHQTAPGQIRAQELSNLYRLHKLTKQTEIMGIVGSPVAHSISPQIHNSAVAALGINAVYVPLEVENLAEFVRRMARPGSRELDWNLRGLSITSPHKIGIMRELDWVDESAQEIGSVNTVVVKDNFLLGYNTDATAALAPLRGLIKLRRARVAVIGAGGVARSLLWSLHREHASMTVFARRIEEAKLVAEKFGARVQRLDGAKFADFDVVVNATPLGTNGPLGNETPATSKQLRGVRLAYDLVYNPANTLFLREARVAGCETVGGLSMLVGQAAEQFRLWTQQEPPLVVMMEAAQHALQQEEVCSSAAKSREGAAQ